MQQEPARRYPPIAHTVPIVPQTPSRNARIVLSTLWEHCMVLAMLALIQNGLGFNYYSWRAAACSREPSRYIKGIETRYRLTNVPRWKAKYLPYEGDDNNGTRGQPPSIPPDRVRESRRGCATWDAFFLLRRHEYPTWRCCVVHSGEDPGDTIPQCPPLPTGDGCTPSRMSGAPPSS